MLIFVLAYLVIFIRLSEWAINKIAAYFISYDPETNMTSFVIFVSINVINATLAFKYVLDHNELFGLI